MVVHDFNIVGVCANPPKADAPLLVHANAPLSRAIAAELFQPVSRRRAQIIQRDGRVDLPELSQRNTLDIRREFPHGPTIKQPSGVRVAEGANQTGW